MWQIALYLVIGLGIGLVSGTMGIGGGVLLVPALMLLWGGDSHFSKARGTSLAVLVMPVVFPGAWKYFRENHVDLTAAVCVGLSFAVGGYLGASIVHKIPAEALWLRMGFGFVMLFIAVHFIISTNNEAAIAAAGLVAAALATIFYFAMRALGRRHLARPSLHQKIQEQAAEEPGGPDYYI
jgi:uncharacterized membrane protein YfcA